MIFNIALCIVALAFWPVTLLVLAVYYWKITVTALVLGYSLHYVGVLVSCTFTSIAKAFK